MAGGKLTVWKVQRGAACLGFRTDPTGAATDPVLRTLRHFIRNAGDPKLGPQGEGLMMTLGARIPGELLTLEVFSQLEPIWNARVLKQQESPNSGGRISEERE